MTITKDDVMYVANLARLTLDESSVEIFADQMAKILEHVDTLNQVDTTGVAPMASAVFLNNAFREDENRPHLDPEKALVNAPNKEDGFFIVPKILG
jgi:aspartyl-tRNA(Asn)/glutamyl-tRNA(Gln) amidotransferase subunit C